MVIITIKILLLHKLPPSVVLKKIIYLKDNSYLKHLFIPRYIFNFILSFIVMHNLTISGSDKKDLIDLMKFQPSILFITLQTVHDYINYFKVK